MTTYAIVLAPYPVEGLGTALVLLCGVAYLLLAVAVGVSKLRQHVTVRSYAPEVWARAKRMKASRIARASVVAILIAVVLIAWNTSVSAQTIVECGIFGCWFDSIFW